MYKPCHNHQQNVIGEKMTTQSLHFEITGQDAQRFAYLQT